MAEALVGGAFLSAFLQVLFDRIACREVMDFFKEGRLNGGLLEKLQIKLLSVNKVLNDAEGRQITDVNVRKWLEKLKNVVYQAEDLLDAIRTDAVRRKREAESQPRSTSKLMNLFHPSSKSFGKGVEGQLEEILNSLDFLLQQKDILGLKEGAGEKPLQRLPSTSLPEEDNPCGRAEDKEAILRSLLSDDNLVGDELCVITIKGMGGIGKTTLARLVYNDDEVERQFDFKAWVSVSEEFDILKVTKTILEAVTSSAPNTNDLNLLQVQLKENLMGKTFFLVLDDVWSENPSHWEILKSPLRHGAKGSKILVTTRNEGVARIMRTIPTHYLKQLSDEDCWLLLARHAFENGNSKPYPALEAIGREIVKRCEGLPLAAKAIGGLLRYKSKPEEWVKIVESSIWDLRNADIIPILQVSYHYLPSHLKQCFAYCAIFPRGYEFEKEELVQLWMAHDFLLHPERRERMEELGDEYFDELVSRSFFQPSRVYGSRFVMHDLINDLAKIVAGPFSFSMSLDSTKEVPEMVRHLSYSTTRLENLEALLIINQLRTFLQVERGEWNQRYPHRYFYHEEVPENLLQSLRLLRALSLRRYEILDLPESIGNLKHLRYLDFSQTAIQSLPDSICNLYNLQTLLLSNCDLLIQLPKDMWKLVNLQYLDISGTRLNEMPMHMGRLKSLQRLSFFIVGKHSGFSIRELRQLSELRGKLSILELENVVCPADAFEARLPDKTYLEKLKFKWSGNSDDSYKEREVLENLKPHRNLKKLAIKSYGGTRFPDWLGDSAFTNVVSVKVKACNYCFSLPPLGQLPSLKRLLLVGFHGLQTVGAEFYGYGSPSIPFRSLEVLRIEDMSQWQEWLPCEAGLEAFPVLQELYVTNCPLLIRDLPRHLPSLTNLRIYECPQLGGPLPSALSLTRLYLKCSGEMLLSEMPSGLQSLTIADYKDLECISEGMVSSNSHLESLFIWNCPSLVFLPQTGLLSTLRSLELFDCEKVKLPMDCQYASLQSLIIEYSCDTLRSIPLHLCPNLLKLQIIGCKNLESLSIEGGSSLAVLPLSHLEVRYCPNFLSFPGEGLPFPNLCDFRIGRCSNLRELPKNMHTLQSLQRFYVAHCPSIKSLPEGGLPSSLSSLYISQCDRLAAALMAWNFHGLTSLRRLTIHANCEGMKSFPEEGLLLPTSLTYLYIGGFSDLKSLDYKGLQHLNSLQELVIWQCPELQSIPEEGLPSSLSVLSVSECSLLEHRLLREQGEDWEKIARIPVIYSNGQLALS